MHNSLASCSSACLTLYSIMLLEWRWNCTLVPGFAFEILFWLNCVEVNCVVLNLSFLIVMTVVCASLVVVTTSIGTKWYWLCHGCV